MINIGYNKDIGLKLFGKKHLSKACVILVCGKRESGRSSLANYLAFYLRNLKFNTLRTTLRIDSATDIIEKIYYSDFLYDFVVIDDLTYKKDLLRFRSNPTIQSIVIKRESSFENKEDVESDIFDGFDVVVSVVDGVDLTGKDVSHIAKDIIKELLKELDKSIIDSII